MFKRYVYLEGLTNLHGSDGKYLINNDGQVKDIKGNDVEYFYDSEGHANVKCKSWDGERDYRVIDLVAIQFKSLNIPIEDYNKVVAFCIDGNKENQHASNIGYRFKDAPLAYKPNPLFFYIPGFTNAAISRDGNLISTITGEPYKWMVHAYNRVKNTKNGYHRAKILFQQGDRVSMSRHRAMALTFMDYPDNADGLEVNHINGTGGDDRLENLEWITHADNCRHAYLNDLRSQQIPVLVRELDTGEIKEYYSMAQCSRERGYAGTEVVRNRVVNAKFGKVFKDNTQFKLKNDPRDWLDPKDYKDEKQVNHFIARNCETGEEFVYDDIKKVADIVPDYHPRAIQKRLNGGSFKPYWGYMFKSVDDPRDFPVLDGKDFKRFNPVAGFTVDARNLLTGETKVYPTIRQAFEEHSSFLATALREGKQPFFESGWQLKYSTDEWQDSADFDEQQYISQRNIMALEVTTGKLYIGENVANLARILKLDSKRVRGAALTRGNEVYGGFRFRLGVSSEPWPTTILPDATDNT